jgi:hypothetical protein
MRKFIIGGLAAFAVAAVPTAVGVPLATANPGTTHCRTENSLFGRGSETTCDEFTDDGGWNTSSTWCDYNGNCTTN